MEFCLLCDAQFTTHTWKYLQVYGESETDRSNDESYTRRLSQSHTDATSWIMLAEGTNKSKMFHRGNAFLFQNQVPRWLYDKVVKGEMSEDFRRMGERSQGVRCVYPIIPKARSSRVRHRR